MAAGGSSRVKVISTLSCTFAWASAGAFLQPDLPLLSLCCCSLSQAQGPGGTGWLRKGVGQVSWHLLESQKGNAGPNLEPDFFFSGAHG